MNNGIHMYFLWENRWTMDFDTIEKYVSTPKVFLFTTARTTVPVC